MKSIEAVYQGLPLIVTLLLLFPILSCTEEQDEYLEIIPFRVEEKEDLYLLLYPGKDAPAGVTETPGSLFRKSTENSWTTGVFHIPSPDISDGANSEKSKKQDREEKNRKGKDPPETLGILPEGNSALGLYCSTGEGGELTVLLFYNGDESPVPFDFSAPPDRKVEFRVPLQAKKRLISFEMISPRENQGFRLLETGVTGFPRGILRQNGVLILNPGAVLSSGFPRQLEYLLSPQEFDSLSLQSSLIIEYDLEGTDAEEVSFSGELILRGEEKTDPESGKEEGRFNIKLRPGKHRLVLPLPRVGFLPKQVRLNGLNLRSLQLLQFETWKAGSTRRPIESELSSILEYPEEKWRGKEWELYLWSAAPNFLVIDTVDYTVQARFFKRLSFFVEKVGFSGTLLTEEEIENRHGWNAHDYRAFDLASFFQLTEDNRLDLTSEEKELRSILLENGIIEKIDGFYHPGRGGILSISRESPGYLRRKFLIHEGMHGLFFSFPRFREGCFSLWNELEEEEQQFFRIFFKKMTYDSSQLFLSVNEYQAYMLQQPVGEIEDYFRAHWASRQIWRDNPELASWYADHPGIFESHAREVESLLFRVTGFKAADIFCLTRISTDGPG